MRFRLLTFDELPLRRVHRAILLRGIAEPLPKPRGPEHSREAVEREHPAPADGHHQPARESGSRRAAHGHETGERASGKRPAGPGNHFAMTPVQTGNRPAWERPFATRETISMKK